MTRSFLPDLRDGRIMASFHELGIVPVGNNKLIIFVITGVIRSVHSFNNRIGMGSRSHVFGVLDEMRLDTVLIDTRSNDDSWTVSVSDEEYVSDAIRDLGIQKFSSLRIRSILFEKKEAANWLARAKGVSWGGNGVTVFLLRR